MLLFTLITLGCVSATDANMTCDDIVTIDEAIDEEITTDDTASDDVLTENIGTFTDLQNEINNAGNTLELTRDYKFNEETDSSNVYLRANFVLDGKGHSLDGAGKTNILRTSDENIVIKNLIFKNANASDFGGALYVGSGPTKVINCTFLNNEVARNYAGGGIYSQAITTIEDCTFINNIADSGGAVYGSGTIINCTFINNTARVSGGGYYGTAPKISKCIFINNTAANSDGGGAYMEKGGQVVEHSIFINNIANLNGGALFYRYTTHIRNVTFINNTARGSGGGLYTSGEFAMYESGDMSDTKFINNTARGDGGGAHINVVGVTDNNVFINNTAGGNGGGTYLNIGEMKNSIYTGNAAKNGGAIWVNNATISDCEFSENTATENGGAIHIHTSSQIVNNEFYKNKANNISNDYTSADENTVIIVATDSEIIAHDGSCTIGADKSYSIALKNIKGFSLSNKTVNFKLNGKNIGSAITNQYGIATIVLTEDILEAAKAGVKDLVISFDGDKGSNPITKTVKFTISKNNFQITPTSASYIINYGGTYKATIKDSTGKAIAGEKVTFTLNGKNIGSATADANGVATIKLTTSILKAAKAGAKDMVVKLNDNYNNKVVKVKINKEAVKITAKKKTFKKGVKTKKYTITLKNSKGKAVKKAKVTIKVNGKTYKATTNAKGKATFKITKLTKKGKYTATVTFKTTAYYLKAAKKVKITIK